MMCRQVSYKAAARHFQVLTGEGEALCIAT